MLSDAPVLKRPCEAPLKNIFIMLVPKFNWSVGRVGRRHLPAKKASGLKPGSLVRIQYTPPYKEN